jgi:hypothetical protein
VREFKDATDDTVVEALAKTAASTSASAEKICSGINAIMRDETCTYAANAMRSRSATEKSLAVATGRIDATYAVAKRTLDQLIRETQPPRVKDAVAAVLASEVRQLLRTMKHEERRAALVAAIKDEDDAFIAAAVSGSHLLTGMTASERDMLIFEWRSARHPQEIARIKRIEAALVAYRRMGELMVTWGFGLHRDEDGAIEAARKSAELAAAAVKAAAAAE